MNRITILTIFILCLLVAPGAFAQYDELLGKEVLLKTHEGNHFVYLGANKDYLNVATEQIMGKDKDSYLTLVFGHKTYMLLNDTKAIVLDIDFPQSAAKVIVMDGPYQGLTGWVLLNSVIGY